MTQKATIDDYIRSQPPEVQELLNEIRRAIHDAVPGAGEQISYQMPTITLEGSSLVHFAAWKHHIGVYPLPEADNELAAELAPYDTRQGDGALPAGPAGALRADRPRRAAAGPTTRARHRPVAGTELSECSAGRSQSK